MVEALQFCIERKIANREISKDIYERAYKALELKAAQSKRTVEISTVLEFLSYSHSSVTAVMPGSTAPFYRGIYPFHPENPFHQ